MVWRLPVVRGNDQPVRELNVPRPRLPCSRNERGKRCQEIAYVAAGVRVVIVLVAAGSVRYAGFSARDQPLLVESYVARTRGNSRSRHKARRRGTFPAAPGLIAEARHTLLTTVPSATPITEREYRDRTKLYPKAPTSVARRRT